GQVEQDAGARAGFEPFADDEFRSGWIESNRPAREAAPGRFDRVEVRLAPVRREVGPMDGADVAYGVPDQRDHCRSTCAGWMPTVGAVADARIALQPPPQAAQREVVRDRRFGVEWVIA